MHKELRHSVARHTLALLTLVGVGVAVFLVSAAGPAIGGPPPAYTYERVSPDLGGLSFSAATSADGRRVAFIHEDADFNDQISLWDRAAQTSELVSTPDGITGADGAVSAPAISTDGQHVAFWSNASNLTADNNDHGGIFVRNLDSATTVRADGDLCATWRAAQGLDTTCTANEYPTPEAAGFPVYADRSVSINGDGTRVVFGATDDHTSHDPGLAAVFLVDLATQQQTLVYSADAARYETQVSTGLLTDPVISADGSTIVFVGETPGATSTHSLLSYSVATGTTTVLLTEGPDVNFATRSTPSISVDDRFVAVALSTDTGLQLRIIDTSNGHEEIGPDMTSSRSSMSGDGRHLLYQVGQDTVDSPLSLAGWDRLTGDVVEVVPPSASNVSGPQNPSVDLTGDVVSFEDTNTIADPSATGYGANVAVRSTDGDTTAPNWAAGSTLTAADIGARDLLLRWTPATDDRGVDHYQVTMDGSSLADVPVDTFSYHVTAGLSPGTHHTFGVRAVDGAGNGSDGPATEATTSTGGGSLVPLSITTGPGGIAHLSWTSSALAGLTGYRVLRGLHGGTLSPVGDVDATTITFTDQGLAASTAYDWQVLALGSGGSTEPHSVVQSATTPALHLSVTWTVPKVSLSVAVLGSDLTVAVHGEVNRTTLATVHYTDGGGAESAPLTLSEVGTGGVYTGTFHLATGITQVTGVDATLSDRAGHTAAASAGQLPLEVSGRVDVTYAALSGELQSPRITAYSAARNAGNGVAASAGGTYPLALAAASDYQVQLLESTGRAAATADGVAVTAGHVTAVTLHPTFVGDVAAMIVDSHGHPVAGAIVTASVGGSSIGSSGTGVDGVTQELAEVPSGTHVTFDVRPPSDLPLAGSSSSLTVASGSNRPTITLQPLAAGSVVGLVKDQFGRALPGSSILVAETVDGRTWSFSGSSGADGRYAVSVLAGVADVTATHGSGATAVVHDVDVPAAGQAETDIVVQVPKPYDLHVALLTQYAGQVAQGPLPINWSVAVHLSMSLSNGATSLPIGSADQWIAGSPGDRVTLCADGRQANLPAGCASATLGSAADVPLTLTLAQRFAVSAHLVDAHGDAWTGPWEVIAVTAGTADQVASTNGTGDAVDLGLPAAGDYDLQIFTWGADSGAATVQVTGDAEADAGTISLQPGQLFAGDGNSLIASRPSAPVGGTAEVRMTYRDSGTDPATGAVARLAVPTGTSLVPGSVTLNGAGVTPDTGSGYADVTLGDVHPDDAGEIRYDLRLTGSPGSQIPVTASLRYAATSESIGPALLTIEGVTLDAAHQTTTLHIPVSGRAPQGSNVSIFDGAAMIGSATASAVGYWTATVTLVDRGPQPWHDLQASTGSSTDVLHSDHVFIDYDPRLPQLRLVTINQPGFLSNSFDPRNGVAYFPIVYAPGFPLLVSATFDRPDLVSNVVVKIGEQSASAGPQLDGSLMARMTKAPQGPIYVDYDSVPTQTTPARSTREQLQASLPSGAIGYQPLPPAPGQTSATSTSGSMNVALPSLGASASLRANFSWTPGVSYTPTGADLAFQQASGVPVYGLAMSDTVGGNSLSGTASAYIPVSAVTSTTSALRLLAQAIAAPARTVSARRPAALSSAQDAEELGRFTLDVVCSECGSADSLIGAFGAGDKYQRLSDLLDSAAGCPSGQANNFRDRITDVRNAALFDDTATGALGVVGLVAAPETFGASLLVNLASGLIGKAMDHQVDGLINQLAGDIAAADCDKDKPPRQPPPGHGGGPVGRPPWIYDPSGYVYEAVPGNRLSGVTATLEEGTTASGPWTVWGAAPFGQTNPLTTNGNGGYGWDVPEGWWKVVFSKAGYQNAQSSVVKVLPPHTDMNVAMVSLATPAASAVAAYSDPGDGAIDITFDKYMLTSTVQVGVTDASTGDPINGTLAPIDGGGNPVATTFRFVPGSALTSGQKVDVTVAGGAQSYSGVQIAGDDESDNVVVGGSEPVPTSPPAPSTGFAPNPGPSFPLFSLSGDVFPPSLTNRPDLTLTATSANGAVAAFTVPTAIDIHDGSVPAACTPASGNVFPNGTTTVKCSAVDRAGNEGTSQFLVTVTALPLAGGAPSTTPTPVPVPTVPTPGTLPPGTAPTVRITAPLQPFHLGAKIRLAWTATDANGVASSDVRYRVALAGGAFGPWLQPKSWRGLKTRSVMFNQARTGTTTCFSVRARDKAGNVSGFSPERCAARPVDDLTLIASGSWTRRHDVSGFYEGTVTSTRTRGATLTIRHAHVQELAIVATVCPGCGRVQVLFNGVAVGETVNLNSPHPASRRIIVLATLPRNEVGTIQLRVVSAGARVEVDALGVSATAPAAALR